MFTVTVPNHLYSWANTYLEHNGQYPNREYYRSQTTNGDYTYSFNSAERYLAFEAFILRRAKFL